MKNTSALALLFTVCSAEFKFVGIPNLSCAAPATTTTIRLCQRQTVCAEFDNINPFHSAIVCCLASYLPTGNELLAEEKSFMYRGE